MAKGRILSGFFWCLLERFGAQGVTLVVSLILARILGPEVYGTVALVLVLIAIFDVFVDSGLGNALVQKKDADETDFSSVFYFNIGVCFLLYALIFLSAPLFAKFYNAEQLTPVIRVMGLELIISGFKNIQFSYLQKHLEFRKFFFATLAGTLTAAPVGIIMAVKGYGVWAIVAQNLCNHFIDTVFLWMTANWKPKRKFSFTKLKVLLNYGWKLLTSALLETVYQKLRQLVIGKKYTSEDLAYYNKGETFPSTLVNNINSAMASVLFPAMSELQDNRESVKDITRKTIAIGSYTLMPLMVGLAVCSNSIILFVLGEAWLPCVPFLRVFCFIYAFIPFHVANLNALKAVGRTDIYLKQEIAKKIIGIAAIIITMNISVIAIAIGLIVTDILDQIINSYPNGKIIHYPYREQLEDMAGPFFLSVIMGGIVLLAGYAPLGPGLMLLIQIPLGIVIYIVLSKLYGVPMFDILINSVKMLFKRQ